MCTSSGHQKLTDHRSMIPFESDKNPFQTQRLSLYSNKDDENSDGQSLDQIVASAELY